MIVVTVLLQILLFLIVHLLAHIISWNIQKRYPISSLKFMFFMAVILVVCFHISANIWFWTVATGICLGSTHGNLESRGDAVIRNL